MHEECRYPHVLSMRSHWEGEVRTIFLAQVFDEVTPARSAYLRLPWLCQCIDIAFLYVEKNEPDIVLSRPSVEPAKAC